MKKQDFLELLNSLGINDKELRTFSLETGFVQRVRKIDAVDFLYSLALESISGTASYNDIAGAIEIENGTSVTRQAIWKKVTARCVNYFKFVLALVIIGKADLHLYKGKSVKFKFNRILIQDSTIVRLPRRLFELFSGVSNEYSQVCNARIQGIFDLVSGRFISFSIDPYSKNDLDSAPELELKKDDLTLRDRGYLTKNEIRRHVSCDAHFIYRYKIDMHLLDYETGEQLDILSVLKERGSIDTLVRLNDRERTVVRIIAKPVDQETADNRRRKAKKEMKGHCPSYLFLQLQSWTIFITTIPSNQADFEDILYLYGFRWRIEIIFKCLKGNLNFDHIHNVSHNQLIIILMARIIMFLIITQIIYTPCNNLINRHIKRNLSLLKLARYLNRHPEMFISILNELLIYRGKLGRAMLAIARYCVYDKRKRQNFEQKFLTLFP